MQNSLKKIGTDPSLSFEVKLSDSLAFSTRSLDELLREENSRSRAIRGIEITGSAEGARINLRIGLEPEGGSRVTVEGDDRQWVYVTLSTMEDRIKRLKQWYHRSFIWGAGAFFLGLTCLIWAMIQVTEKYPVQLLTTTPQGNRTLTGVGFLILIGAGSILLWAMPAMTARLFPDLTFSIGDGKRRYETLASIRSRILWFLVVTVGLGTVFRLATQFLF